MLVFSHLSGQTFPFSKDASLIKFVDCLRENIPIGKFIILSFKGRIRNVKLTEQWSDFKNCSSFSSIFSKRIYFLKYFSSMCIYVCVCTFVFKFIESHWSWSGSLNHLLLMLKIELQSSRRTIGTLNS